MPEDRRAETAVRIARTNWGLVIGNFEMNWETGEVRYKTSADLRDIDPVDMVIGRLIHANVLTMDRYLPEVIEDS